jgi:hypothetical protein
VGEYNYPPLPWQPVFESHFNTTEQFATIGSVITEGGLKRVLAEAVSSTLTSRGV